MADFLTVIVFSCRNFAGEDNGKSRNVGVTLLEKKMVPRKGSRYQLKQTKSKNQYEMRIRVPKAINQSGNYTQETSFEKDLLLIDEVTMRDKSDSRRRLQFKMSCYK